ncbi:MAG: GYD domain-containing protein [Chloroflexota bacterium]
MAIYIMLTTLTDEGRKTLKSNPARIKEVNKEVEAMGVKIMAQYAVLGPYDFVNILEAKDNKAVAKVSLELGSRGTLQTMTLAAMTIDELIAAGK